MKAKALCWLLILIIVGAGLAVVSCGNNAKEITVTSGDGTMIKFKDSTTKPLILADTGARTILSPTEVPIGVITAFIGAPFFLYLLRRKARMLF